MLEKTKRRVQYLHVFGLEVEGMLIISSFCDYMKGAEPSDVKEILWYIGRFEILQEKKKKKTYVNIYMNMSKYVHYTTTYINDE